MLDERNETRALALGLALLTALRAVGCQQRQEQWEDFSPPDGSFTVTMPGKPREQTRTEKADGISVQVRTFGVEVPLKATAFAVAYTDFPQDTIFMGMDYRRGTVLNSKLISHAVRPGRKSTIKTRDGTFHRLRYFQVGQRVYDISVSATKEERLFAPDAEQFLNSLRIQPK